ncbi:hypothetical protein GFY24_40585 [Nocardia sp. SYP-A9097]|uniref:hypothetical protein n=1 Tax=Nocardia sp. SYP-A9097 TaxID=2663237 RepID=UPI00129BD5D8|nr:hypothetical protein [Nocardia sp. SYP-A9097]MRH93622.1 hypothetical protein [Nocardia sp. SYP-A9097]
MTDIRDGRMYVGNQVIPLAAQVSVLMATYLSHRADRWPRTANPHLVINMSTAGKTSEAGYQWINRRLGFRAQDLREDRIIQEVQATGGDIRRICDLFGLTVGAAQRYVDGLDPPAGIGEG